MKITIDCDSKKFAAFAVELQEQQKVILDKQMEILSEASQQCFNEELLPALTHAMVEISLCAYIYYTTERGD